MLHVPYNRAGQIFAAAALIVMTGSCAIPSSDIEPSGGRILAPLGGCAAIGAWNVVDSHERPGVVRFEMLIGANPGGSIYEVDCSHLSYSQVALTMYDEGDNLVRTIPVNRPLQDERAATVLRQVCAISRGEAVQTYGDFTSVSEFRTKSKRMDPAYFAGQPPCLTFSGPLRIVPAN